MDCFGASGKVIGIGDLAQILRREALEGVSFKELPADVDALMLERALAMFVIGPSFPTSSPYDGTYGTEHPPLNGDLRAVIVVVDLLFKYNKARFECRPEEYLTASEAYGYLLADRFNFKLPAAQHSYEIGKRALKRVVGGKGSGLRRCVRACGQEGQGGVQG